MRLGGTTISQGSLQSSGGLFIKSTLNHVLKEITAGGNITRPEHHSLLLIGVWHTVGNDCAVFLLSGLSNYDKPDHRTFKCCYRC